MIGYQLTFFTVMKHLKSMNERESLIVFITLEVCSLWVVGPTAFGLLWNIVLYGREEVCMKKPKIE